ncbi:MAG: carboxypeptidase regulatory-like domain-containing protein [Candidatus Acidiferrum sp.]
MLSTPRALFAEQTADTQISIRVTDPIGAAVVGVLVRLVPSPDSPPSKMETDEKGQLSLALTPGGYSLFIDFAGFKPVATFINVQAGKEVQVVPVRLELADTFSPMVSPDPATPKGDLRVSAQPYHEDLLLTPDQFKALPHTTVTVHNEHTKADETYSGVRVADLLSKMDAPLGNKLRGAALSAYLVATGSDGYVAVVALAEADPSFHSGEVIVADTMNGQPIGEKSGPFKLVVTEDKRPARWVRNLVSLELRSVK